MESDAARARLLALAQDRGVSLSGLSRLIGKNPSYLQQFVRKGSPRKLEEGARATLARFFGVAEVELGASTEKYDDEAGWVAVPRLSLAASAGPGALAEGEDIIGRFRFSSRWLRELGVRPDQVSAIRVQGDSMEPTLREGDEILVATGPAALRDGIHVVRLDGAMLVKRLELGGGGRITLLSDNKAYSPIACTARELTVIGRVVWKGGRL